METIHCRVCNIDKPRTDFYAKSVTESTKKGYCKECKRAQAKAWKLANPERNKETNKKWNDNNFSKKRYSLLKKNYGITPEEYQVMFDAQSGCCQICQKHQSEFDRRLAVDHNHETGKVRALLCLGCNKMLGLAKDNPELLLRAIEYLKVFIS